MNSSQNCCAAKLLGWQELENVLHKNGRTIRRQIKAENLPKPIMDGNEIYFNAQEIAEALGAKDLSEPFISIEEAAQILNMPEQKIRSFCRARTMPIPFYKLTSNRGETLLFRQSELEEYKQTTFIKSSDYQNFYKGYRTLLEFFKNIFDNSDLSERSKAILEMYFLEHRTAKYISKKLGLSAETIRVVLQDSTKAISLKQKKQAKEIQRLNLEINSLNNKIDELKHFIKTNEKIIAKIEPRNQVKIAIEEVGFSVRTFNCLKSSNIKLLNDLEEMEIDNLLRTRNLGEKSFFEIINAMKANGMRIKTSPKFILD